MTDDAVEAARAAEAANALPRDAFYDAEPGDEAPGALLRAEDFDGWSVPGRGRRILYASRSADGHPVVTSAAVVVPDGEAPEGGWPLVAWAHGTSGVAKQCAPSLMRDLYYPELIGGLLGAGYAVVATDYSGLGAGGVHEYVTMPANADDVRYSVAAAGEAVPGISDRWIAVGHSQGGQAAWGAAKRQAGEPVGRMLGAAAMSPATPLGGATAAVLDEPGTAAYLPYVAYVMSARFDGFRPEDLLTEVGMAHYDEYIHDGGLAFALALTGTHTMREYLNPAWPDHPATAEFVAVNRYADAPLDVPLFVASGTDDEAVAAATVSEVVAEQCSHGATVRYREYPGDHDGMIDAAAPDLLAWIAARFAGEPAPSTC